MSAKLKVTPYRNLSVVPTGAVASATPVKIAYIQAHNKNAAVVYLKLYDKATAADQTDTPVHTIAIPASGSIPLTALDGREIPFNTGLSVRATTGIADNDTGAPAANDVTLNLGLVENLSYTH